MDEQLPTASPSKANVLVTEMERKYYSDGVKSVNVYFPADRFS